MLRHAADAICLGISVLTGPMIGVGSAGGEGHEAAGSACAGDLWRLASQPASRADSARTFVDVVVRGQGELTLLEVADTSQPGKSSRPFTVFRGQSAKPASRAMIPNVASQSLDSLPTPAFDLRISMPTRRLRRPEACIRHQCRMSICLQLLHGHGVL